MESAQRALKQQGMPANLEAERALLGAVLVNNDLLDQILEQVEAEDMASQAHQRIFRIIRDLRAESLEMDPITVTERLHRTGELETVGGAEYISDLVTGIPRIETSEHYIQIIKDCSLLRQLILRSREIMLNAFNSPEEPQEILAQAERSILELGDMSLKSSLVDMRTIAEKAGAIFEKRMKEGRNITGVATSFHDLDDMTSGFQPADLVVLAARPSVGKTALALSVALNVAKSGRPVAFFSLEMGAEQLFFRMLSMAAKVDHSSIRRGIVRKKDMAELTMQFDTLSKFPIHIDDSPILTTIDMGAKLRRLKQLGGLGLVVVDYLQLMRGVGPERRENRNQEVASISRGLKALAKELDVPVLALSQLSRAPEKRGEGKEPILSDLRDSGSIEQDADVVIFLHRNIRDPEGQNIAKLIIAKQRNGPVGTLQLTFLNRFALFANYQPEVGYEP